ncbi:MAG: cytidine deaminase [Flavobacteriales bacterium]|nr:cytidine deaminase [Flavobacteriales bacterium]MCW8914088.1 cytidine deaminase [Flavobacteriales bacterium]MCW8938146.1 cytidine deaminase [Flavobacteriales bacterium]MCW8939777.1 cytidine deaminase [Flavobacteriales bacterium]MCW8968235.1 cytidine deaminase [Flavobacteriales bacterium]
MKEQEFTIRYKEYQNDELHLLPEQTRQLIQLADENLKNAYAPYSNFEVSAALQLANNEIIKGTNQENAAYPSGTCAERVAVFYANSKYPNEKINEIVITTTKNNQSPLSPCGSCRQALIEYEKKQQSPIGVVLKSGNSAVWVFNSIADLLPFAFDANQLLDK